MVVSPIKMFIICPIAVSLLKNGDQAEFAIKGIIIKPITAKTQISNK
ncbi:MAG: hypothetical protein ACTSP3_00830 [Candidatus Heimdallarchaeaceae archaeon]